MSHKDKALNINFIKIKKNIIRWVLQKNKNLSTKIQAHKDIIKNETKAKQFFINPFLDAMSYCHTNP